MRVSDSRPAESFFRRPDDRRSRRRVKVSTALRFYNEVLGLEHLHYGLWNGESPNLENLRAAQHRYLQRLLAEIPTDVRSILDVGSGIGATSAELLKRGYEVEGLSPDPIQQAHYQARVGRPFHLGRFQEFYSAQPFDLVMMSESAQYVWLDDLFKAVRRTVDQGWLLVSDYFVVREPTDRHEKSGHRLDDFLRRSEAAGFELEFQEDITERVLPTLELGNQWLRQWLLPSLNIARDMVADRRPLLFRAARFFSARWIEKKFTVLQGLLSTEEFRRVKRYMILRFRIPAIVGDLSVGAPKITPAGERLVPHE